MDDIDQKDTQQHEDLDAILRSTPTDRAPPSGAGKVTVVEPDPESATDSDEIRESIDRADPDVVAVELDALRYDELVGETETDVGREDIVSGTTSAQLLGHWLLAGARTRLEDRSDADPDAHLEDAVSAADAQDRPVALVDRPLADTAADLWGRLSWRAKLTTGGALIAEFGGPLKAGLGIGLFWGLLIGATVRLVQDPLLLPVDALSSGGSGTVGALLGPLLSILDAVLLIVVLGLAFGIPLWLLLARATRGFENAEVDGAATQDAVGTLIAGHSTTAADADVLSERRDAVTARRLLALRDSGYDVLAVVTVGRRPRLERFLEEPPSIPPATVDEVTGSNRLRSILYRVVGYAFTLGFLSLFGLLALGGAQDWFVIQLFAAWFLVNFAAAAGVAWLAGAHWTSAGAGGAVAWLTSVNPFITPGLFIAYVELQYTSVKLADIFRIKDTLSKRERGLLERLRGLHAEVGLFRLLAIMTVANLASFVASVLFVVAVLPYLAADVGGLEGVGETLLEGIREGVRLLETLSPLLVR